MPAYTTINFDDQGPQGLDVQINTGASHATNRDVTANLSSTSGDVAEVKIWGDVDPAANPDIQPLEGDSDWISWTAAQAVRLSAGDGVKTINVRARDDVWNESGVDSDSITLDTTAPIPNITVEWTPPKISKVSGKRITTGEWAVNTDFVEYEIRIVPAESSTRAAGVLIPENFSTNTQDAGNFPAATNIVSQVDGRDVDAVSPGSGNKIFKIFVRDEAGNWSV